MHIIRIKMLKYSVFIFVVLINVSFVICGIFTRGNTKVNLEYINVCENVEPKLELVLKWERCNKTHRCARGFFTLDEETDKDYVAEIIAQKWGDGGWKDNAFHWKLPDACNSIATIIGKNWKALANNFGEDKCPFHPGRHEIKDFYVDFSDIPVAFMYGKYNIVFHLLKFNQLLMCKEFVLNVA